MNFGDLPEPHGRLEGSNLQVLEISCSLQQERTATNIIVVRIKPRSPIESSARPCPGFLDLIDNKNATIIIVDSRVEPRLESLRTSSV